MVLKAIFFDIDDTLYDSSKLTAMARMNSIKAMIDSGLPEKDENKVYKILEGIIAKFGPNYGKHYDELLRELGLKWDPKIIAAGVVAYEHTKVGYLKPFPGVIPTLLELKSLLD
jgi:putative hydrolase of the HAD superfamily